MKDWVVLQRTKGEPKSGEYAQVYKSHPYGLEIWCTWVCPECVAKLSLGRKYHTINYLGEADPMVTCPKKCGFTRWIKLEDWIPEAMGNA